MEQRLARTYNHPSYEDPYDAVKDYCRVQRSAANHPNKGSSALSSIVELPRSRIREWIDDETARMADPTRAISVVLTGYFEGQGLLEHRLHLGIPVGKVASRAATTPDVIRRYYDQPDLDEGLDRRRAETGDIDIQQHLSPEDLLEDDSEGDL